ncbi:MAG: hypothetical protein PR2021_1160 [Candidatus Phytoplasma pruni]|uniref:hypothetical protein n=1 Tax=Poinsettia branch-inducing phytoplasma TaxID=138647 RepID=UPI00036D3872|nr:hypothetical protein [Poinsettia branch-inducing phytoplasma]WEK82190.1 MAG: hypothetical protein PR2021_1160 [Candidatus Phytoplasma pruni]
MAFYRPNKKKNSSSKNKSAQIKKQKASNNQKNFNNPKPENKITIEQTTKSENVFIRTFKIIGKIIFYLLPYIIILSLLYFVLTKAAPEAAGAINKGGSYLWEIIKNGANNTKNVTKYIIYQGYDKTKNFLTNMLNFPNTLAKIGASILGIVLIIGICMVVSFIPVVGPWLSAGIAVLSLMGLCLNIFPNSNNDDDTKKTNPDVVVVDNKNPNKQAPEQKTNQQTPEQQTNKQTPEHQEARKEKVKNQR